MALRQLEASIRCSIEVSARTVSSLKPPFLPITRFFSGVRQWCAEALHLALVRSSRLKYSFQSFSMIFTIHGGLMSWLGSSWLCSSVIRSEPFVCEWAILDLLGLLR